METNLRLVLLLVGCLIILGVLWDMWRRYRQDRTFRAQMADLNQEKEDDRSNRLSQLSADHFEQTIYTQRLAGRATPSEKSRVVQRTIEKTQCTQGQTKHAIEPSSMSRVEPTFELRQEAFQKKEISSEKITAQTEFVVEKETTKPEPIESTKQKPKSQTTYSISVVARDPRGFQGQQLLTALETANLSYGKMNIFHRMAQSQGNGDILFSACRVDEPGYFSYTSLPEQRIPGVALFFVAENVADPVATLISMVGAAKQLSFNLNGDLRDHQHKPLTIHTVDKYKEQLLHLHAQQEEMLAMAELS